MYKITVKEDIDFACGEPICEPDNKTIYLLGINDISFEDTVELLWHELLHEIIYEVLLRNACDGDGLIASYASTAWDSSYCGELQRWIWDNEKRGGKK